jgi:hypothetical protein
MELPAKRPPDVLPVESFDQEANTAPEDFAVSFVTGVTVTVRVDQSQAIEGQVMTDPSDKVSLRFIVIVLGMVIVGGGRVTTNVA